MMSRKFAFAAAAAVLALTAPFGAAMAQSPSADAKPYQVEWVYRVRYGGQDEWWRLFQKYQIATLDREKQLGYVLTYKVVRPSLHTSEDARWDYRIEIVYASQASASHGGEVERALFPDSVARKRDENRRWELTLNHWDLPIHESDPHAEPE
jgi:opacity protein-like surface antigen